MGKRKRLDDSLRAGDGCLWRGVLITVTPMRPEAEGGKKRVSENIRAKLIEVIMDAAGWKRGQAGAAQIADALLGVFVIHEDACPEPEPREVGRHE